MEREIIDSSQRLELLAERFNRQVSADGIALVLYNEILRQGIDGRKPSSEEKFAGLILSSMTVEVKKHYLIMEKGFHKGYDRFMAGTSKTSIPFENYLVRDGRSYSELIGPENIVVVPKRDIEKTLFESKRLGICRQDYEELSKRFL